MGAEPIGAGRIDDETFLQGGSAKQHSEQHGVAIGQGQFYPETFVTHLYISHDDIALFSVAARVSHPAFINDGHLTDNLSLSVALVRMHPETHPPFPGPFERFHKIGVQ